MRKLAEYFVDRPLVVNLMSVLILLVGMVTLFGLRRETFPPVEFDVILITTEYAGSSAEDVEKLVTIPIERQLKAVNGIKELDALSAEGRSIIYLEMEADTDIDEAFEEVKTALDSVQDLPDDAEVPLARKLTNSTRGVMKIALTGLDYQKLRIEAKVLRDRIEQLPGVRIELDGYNPDQIEIAVDPLKLRRYELSMASIVNALIGRNMNLSSGSLKASQGDLLIRTIGEFEKLSDIENTVLSSNYSGYALKIKDVARVTRGPDAESITERTNGQQAIFLDVKVDKTVDILRISEKTKAVAEKFMLSRQGTGLQHTYLDEASFYVKRRLDVLKNNGAVGMVLVFLCLLIFLNFRTSVVTSMGAPIAFMASFIIIDAAGMSLNLISMFALILVLGMLVDDSIIVAEQFYQKVEKGIPSRKAAIDAAIETMKPVSGTIITTIIAFGSLFFMGGIMGKFLWSVPAIVIICLLASWFECFFILPNHLKHFCSMSASEIEKMQSRGGRWYKPLLHFYESTLVKALTFPKTIVTIFMLILSISIFYATKMKFELFPGDDVTTIYFQIKGKVGTPYAKTLEAVEKIEKLVLQLPKEELESMKSSVGYLRGDQGNKIGSHYGSFVLYLTMPIDRKRTTDEILDDLAIQAKKVIGDFEIVTKKLQGGPPKGKPVEIDLAADSLEMLKVVSSKVEEKLKTIDGVISTEIDFEAGKEQIVVTVEEEEAKRLGVSTRDVALELRRAFARDTVSEIRESDEDIDIKVVYDRDFRKTMDDLHLLTVLNNQGKPVQISSVAKMEKRPGAFVIRRNDRKRVISVSATLDKAKATPTSVAKSMQGFLELQEKENEGLRFHLGGENEDTKESMFRLGKSALIALSCIFFVLVFMFGSLAQPLIVMSAIPMGLVGVVWSFAVFGQSLGFMAMMGIVGLVGVVVNDSIVLVDFINVSRQTDKNSFQAIVAAAVSRLRPVLLTTFTTVAGLLPLAHASKGDPFLKPMAMSFAYGLLFATFVTLIFVPVSYLLYSRILDWSQSILVRIRPQPPQNSID